MNQTKRKVYVVGVGMTKFDKPGKNDYPEMGEQAVKRALQDANIRYNEVEQVCVGYVYGDSTCGQRAVYGSIMNLYNVNNNCSTGSTALLMAKQFVEGGIADCVLALGFEKMERGSLGIKFTDRANPLERHGTTMVNLRGLDKAPVAPQMFGNAGKEHMEKYGTTQEQFAKIAVKNHKHSKNNPYSQFRDEYSLEQVLKSPKVFGPLTKLQCCPTSDGAAAAILCSEDFVRRHNLESQAVEVLAMAMRTDFPNSFQDSCIKMAGYDMSKAAAEAVFKQAGMKPTDVQVIELHGTNLHKGFMHADCFSCNELLTYEALGLCKEGEGGKLIDRGDVTYGGKWVVNPSGGLISKGHPLGATGLAQCAELCWQLRGMCGARQVSNAKVALQHNIGLGGAAVVSLYRLGFPSQFKPYPPNKKNYAVDADDGPETRQSSSTFKSAAIFDAISKTLRANPSLFTSINGIYQFELNGPNGEMQAWVVDVMNAPGSVKQGTVENHGCKIIMSDENFTALMNGTANARELLMNGQLKMEGDMALAMKLRELQAAKAKL